MTPIESALRAADLHIPDAAGVIREHLEALQRDAGRYRWLRAPYYGRWQLVRDWCEHDLDHAIDTRNRAND